MIVRAGVDLSPAARSWTSRLGREIRGHAPDLLWIEVASALRGYVATGNLAQEKAHEVMAYASRLPLEIRQLRGLAAAALDAALLHSLSVYDACYLVLAESVDAILVTADQGLASVAARAELIA